MKKLEDFLKPIKSLNVSISPRHDSILDNTQYDLLSQVRYFIQDTHGVNEYDAIQDAGVVGLQDGDTTINITTIDRPINTGANSITKVLRGWLSSYKKYDSLKENVRAKTKLAQDFAASMIKKYPMKDISLFYFPESKTEDVIILNYFEVDDKHKNSGIGSMIMNDLISFADNQNFILILNTSDKFGSSPKRLKAFYKRFGFKINKDKRFREEMIRLPKNGINESMTFSKIPVYNKEVKKENSIQDIKYLEKWYEEFINILNSTEYQKRRYNETYGNMVAKTSGSNSRIGFAIVGKSITTDG